MWIDPRGFLAFDWTLSLSHHGSYLNIDDILSTNDRLPCKTRISVHRIAHLLIGSVHSSKRSQPSTEDAMYESDVPQGAKLEIPIWLISSIGSSRRQIFLIELPIIYREIYREVFAADPWVVDLRRKCPYFYSVGCHLSSLLFSEMPAVIATLEDVFQRRIKNLMEASINAKKVSIVGLISRLEELEQALFRIGRSGRCSIDRWFLRLHWRLEPSTVAKVAEASAEASAPPSKRSREASVLREWN
ncbi:DNA replication complex GINS protein PSF3 [Echinococcus multilocularis]|uniref:DNA replication complex GINS protein PSF3 n=1 Tax=Echinococcus multilocularis TaxID=6211 RepID=A0A068Y3S3_ECHMU|nr:DNA replication complex GINS protein PSF3 [Echinococcus multilocularis]